MEIVSSYNINGWVEDLPKLQTGRRIHGCGHFFSETNGLVKIIIIKMNIAGGGTRKWLFQGEVGMSNFGSKDQP